MLGSWHISILLQWRDSFSHKELGLLNIERHGLGRVGSGAGRETLGVEAFPHLAAESPLSAIITNLVTLDVIGLWTWTVSLVDV